MFQGLLVDIDDIFFEKNNAARYAYYNDCFEIFWDKQKGLWRVHLTEKTLQILQGLLLNDQQTFFYDLPNWQSVRQTIYEDLKSLLPEEYITYQVKQFLPNEYNLCSQDFATPKYGVKILRHKTVQWKIVHYHPSSNHHYSCLLKGLKTRQACVDAFYQYMSNNLLKHYNSFSFNNVLERDVYIKDKECLAQDKNYATENWWTTFVRPEIDLQDIFGCKYV